MKTKSMIALALLALNGYSFSQNCEQFKVNEKGEFDKEKMFSSITHAILSGKLKAYRAFSGSDKELTLKEFNNILVSWDTSDTPMVALDTTGGSGEIPIGTPVMRRLTSEDITQLKFNETIEFDTVSYTLCKKVSRIAFYTYKLNERSEQIGQKELFYVNLNDFYNEKTKK